MSHTVFLTDDPAVVRDGLKLWLENQADLQVGSVASHDKDTVRRVASLGALRGWSTAGDPGKQGLGTQTPPFLTQDSLGTCQGGRLKLSRLFD